MVWALTLEPAKLFSAMLPTEPPQRAHCEKNMLRITLDELTALALHKWNLAGPKANRPVVFANQRRTAIAAIAPDVTQAVSISWQSDDARGSLAGRNASRPGMRRRLVHDTPIYRGRGQDLFRGRSYAHGENIVTRWSNPATASMV